MEQMKPPKPSHLKLVRPTDGVEQTLPVDDSKCPQCVVSVQLDTMSVRIGWANCQTPQNAALILMALEMAKRALLNSTRIEDDGPKLN